MKEKDKQRIVAVIQARMGSMRLPKKALLKIMGKTLVEWIVYRLSFSKEIDGVVLSTSTLRNNDSLVTLAKKIELVYYRGSERDLIKRLLKTAQKFKADAIVRITGDCPLVDPNIVDVLVKEFRRRPGIDYVCNIFPPTYPDGMDVEIISIETLRHLNENITSPLYREWLTTTILENPKDYKIINVPFKSNNSHLRLTVDYAEDFKLVKRIYEKLHRVGGVFYLSDILDLIRKEPSLTKMNENRVDRKVVNNIRSEEFYKLKSKI